MRVSAKTSNPLEFAMQIGSVFLRRRRSLPTGLPVTLGSPQTPSMSSMA